MYRDNASNRRRVLGVILPSNDTLAFVVLAFGCVISSLLFSILQESIVRTPGFRYPASLSTLTSISYFLCAAAHVHLTRLRRKGRWRDYATLALLTYGGMAGTNSALQYINYPTRILCKSVKLVPVMAFSACCDRRKFTRSDWVSAFLLIIGILSFSHGAARDIEVANYGFILIFTAVCIDAVSSNFEEQYFFRKLSAQPADVICFSSPFGALYGFLHMIWTKEIKTATAFSHLHPWIPFEVVIFSAMGYCSATFTLALVKYFGAAEAEAVKTLRKTVSVLASFTLYRRKWSLNHTVGLLLVILSMLIVANQKRRYIGYIADYR